MLFDWLSNITISIDTVLWRCYNEGRVSTSIAGGEFIGLYRGYENDPSLGVDPKDYELLFECCYHLDRKDALPAVGKGLPIYYSYDKNNYTTADLVAYDVTGVVTLSKAETQKKTSFKGFDFDTIWQFKDSKPSLRYNAIDEEE